MHGLFMMAQHQYTLVLFHDWVKSPSPTAKDTLPANAASQAVAEHPISLWWQPPLSTRISLSWVTVSSNLLRHSPSTVTTQSSVTFYILPVTTYSNDRCLHPGCDSRFTTVTPPSVSCHKRVHHSVVCPLYRHFANSNVDAVVAFHFVLLLFNSLTHNTNTQDVHRY